MRRNFVLKLYISPLGIYNSATLGIHSDFEAFVVVIYTRMQKCNHISSCLLNKLPGQKTPRIKNTKAKLDIKHYCKIGHKTLSKKHYCKKIRYKSKSKKGDVHNSII